jgi:hypothetical protein
VRYLSSYIPVLIAAHPFSDAEYGQSHRSEDASCLKSRMGSYAAPNPDKDLVSPPIRDDSMSRSKMGFNHPQLGPLLCPAKFLVEYNKDLAE